jgi:hypothetical protein
VKYHTVKAESIEASNIPVAVSHGLLDAGVRHHGQRAPGEGNTNPVY